MFSKGSEQPWSQAWAASELRVGNRGSMIERVGAEGAVSGAWRGQEALSGRSRRA